MKQELLRFQDIRYKAKGQEYGPLCIQLFEGELTGILTDDFFDKERLIDLFCGKIQNMRGFFYLKETFVPSDEQIKVIKKIHSEWISVISGHSRLFEELSIVENIFFPHFLFKSKRLNKIVQELFLFFQLNIPLNKRVENLTLLERIEIELLHAVVCRHKLIIISDINKSLKKNEILFLNSLYERLIQMGFTICLIESLTDVTMDMLKYFSLLRRGKTVGCGYRGEYSYGEAYTLLNASYQVEEYQNLLKKKERKFYKNRNFKILECDRIAGKWIREISFSVNQGEIVQIVCRKHDVYTELTKILTGEMPAVFGEIYFEGSPAECQDIKTSVKKWEIGCVDTSVGCIFTNKTIWENICYPLSLKIPFFYVHKKYLKAVKDYIKDTVPEIDLHTEVCFLSMEQIIWISICKWVLSKPKLFLFFVPATTGIDNLDFVTEKLLIELKIYGIPILIVTEQHEITTEITDEVIVI